MFTLYRRAFAPPRESYWIGLLFTHKDGCGGGNSVTERSFSALISKVERHNLVRRGCDPFVQRRGPIHWTKVTELWGRDWERHSVTYRIGLAPYFTAQLRSVTEIAPKSPFLGVNSSPICYDFLAGTRAIRYSVYTA